MKTGVLLVNSGTPASLETRDVRAFLAGLLGDPRVVELPRILWWPILHGIILRVRPKASARKYAAVWTPAGSPLAVESEEGFGSTFIVTLPLREMAAAATPWERG